MTQARLGILCPGPVLSLFRDKQRLVFTAHLSLGITDKGSWLEYSG